MSMKTVIRLAYRLKEQNQQKRLEGGEQIRDINLDTVTTGVKKGVNMVQCTIDRSEANLTIQIQASKLLSHMLP